MIEIQSRRVLVVGSSGGTHMGASFQRAAPKLGVSLDLLDSARAYDGPSAMRRLMWHAARRPLGLARFARSCVEEAERFRADVVIATGIAPLHRGSLEALGGRKIQRVNVSTDDPWNSAHRARWFLDALPVYDLILTPRHANVDDFRRVGCRDVRYMPFGYDDDLFVPPGSSPLEGQAPEVLFVGGADADRSAFFDAYRVTGCPITLGGAYWERYPSFAKLSLGQLSPQALTSVTARASVNLCLVRKANRDGHVMRSYEIAAVGGFMITEDTEDHRRLFGPEGECVLYFASPVEAAEKVQWALSHPDERKRMAAACHQRITNGENTYRDRLRQILAIVT